MAVIDIYSPDKVKTCTVIYILIYLLYITYRTYKTTPKVPISSVIYLSTLLSGWFYYVK